MATSIGYLINTTGSLPIISGTTPFSLYDAESNFQIDGPNVAKWVAAKLGANIVQVELTFNDVYACFEEAVSEYSSQVNNSHMIDWLLNSLGSNTGSEHTNIQQLANFEYQKRHSSHIGSEIGVGGFYDWKTGSIEIQENVQTYDIQKLWGNVSESNSRIEVKEIWHYAPAAMNRGLYYDLSSGQSFANSEFNGAGSVGYSGPLYYMMPLYQDLLRAQAVELNDLIRKSNYSWEIINNKLKIYPSPTASTTLFFRYRVNFDPLNSDDSSISSYITGVTSVANIKYSFIPYNTINSMGKQWIRLYTLALSKELLGHIRSKYGSIPIPDGEVSLDGDALISEGNEEKQALMEQIKDLLEKTSMEAMMEAESNTQDHLQNQFNKIPLGIFVG